MKERSYFHYFGDVKPFVKDQPVEASEKQDNLFIEFARWARVSNRWLAMLLTVILLFVAGYSQNQRKKAITAEWNFAQQKDLNLDLSKDNKDLRMIKNVWRDSFHQTNAKLDSTESELYKTKNLLGIAQQNEKWLKEQYDYCIESRDFVTIQEFVASVEWAEEFSMDFITQKFGRKFQFTYPDDGHLLKFAISRDDLLYAPQGYTPEKGIKELKLIFEVEDFSNIYCKNLVYKDSRTPYKFCDDGEVDWKFLKVLNQIKGKAQTSDLQENLGEEYVEALKKLREEFRKELSFFEEK